MPSVTSQLVVNLIDGVSGPARQVGRSINGMNRTIRDAARPASFGERISAAITRNDQALAQTRGAMLDAVGTLYILKNALSAPVASAQEFERSLADLGAKANIPVEQLKLIGQNAARSAGEVNQFATNIIKAQDFLVGMGLDAERASKAMPTIGRTATATGASLEDLSKAGFAAMSNLGIGAEDLGKSFDVMAQAGKDGGFELKDMAQYLPSITALGASKGMTGQKGLAQIAAALQIVRRGAGDSAEAATNFNNILQKINSNDAIKNFKKKGIDIQKVLKDAAAKGADPLEAALGAINKAIKGDTSRLGEIFSDAQVQKGLLPLLTNLKDYIELRDKAGNASGVVDKDFDRMMETGAEKTKAFQIALQNFQTGVGTALIPLLNKITQNLVPILNRLTELVNAHPRIAGALVGITAGFVGLKAALTGLRFIGLTGKGGALSMLSFAVNGLGGALGRVGANVGEVTRLQRALAQMSGQKFTGLDAVVSAARGLAYSAPGAASFVSALSGLGGLLATISAPAWGMFAIAAAAIGAAGLLIYKYWDRITATLSGVGSAIGDLLAPAIEKIRPLLNWMAPIGEQIANGWERAKSAVSSVTSWLGTLFQQETLTDADKEKARQAGYDFVMALWNGMKQVFNDLISWVSSQVDRLVAPVRNAASRVANMFGGAASSSSVQDTGNADPMGNVTGARARGGPVSRGSSYLVGERGPELITAGRSGYVNRTAESGGNRPINVTQTLNFNIAGKADDDAIEKLRRVMRDEVRETFRGVFSDTGLRFA